MKAERPKLKSAYLENKKLLALSLLFYANHRADTPRTYLALAAAGNVSG
jgi:hypothetical protein